MENKDEFPYKLLCSTCLCFGKTLQVVKDEKIKQYYMNILQEIPLHTSPLQCPNMCCECLALLRNSVKFREQVQDSYRILQTYTNENLNEYLLTDVTRPPRFKITRVDSVDIQPNAISEDRTVKEEPKELQVVCVKNEFKNEYEDVDVDTRSQFDSSDEEQLSFKVDTTCSKAKNLKENEQSEVTEDKIKKKIDALLKVKKNRLSKKKMKKMADDKNENNKSGQKIHTVELTYEEMMSEREKESKRDSYTSSKFKCDSCIIGFNFQASYNSHMSTKHSSKIGDYNCPICKSIFSCIESFTTHYRRHVRRYVCGICQKRTVDLKVMQQHYYSTHEISLKQYTCSLCGHMSNSCETHRYHMDKHKARLQCPECDKTFTHRAGLNNHRLAVHELRNAFPCTICNKVLRWKTSLKRHMEQHDLQGKSNNSSAYCSTCEMNFASMCSYKRHLKNSLRHVTQDQLRYICDHCNRRFSDKTKLRDHIEEKHLHKTFQCHICLKPSKNRVGLDQHIRNVHRGRPNNKMCHHCGKGFPTKMQLESHIRTHTGERPFICEFCPTMFSQQSNLYKHNRQVHLNMKSKRYSCKKRKDETYEPSTQIEMPQQPTEPYRNMMTVLQYSPDRYCHV